MAAVKVRDRCAVHGPARAARRALRAEKAQLLRWRRLVRARLDLAVAAYAPPDALGAMSWEILPEAQLALPHPTELLEAVRCVGDDQVSLMQRLKVLDQLLADYEAHVDAALESSTQEIIGALAGAPCGHRDAR